MENEEEEYGDESNLSEMINIKHNQAINRGYSNSVLNNYPAQVESKYQAIGGGQKKRVSQQHTANQLIMNRSEQEMPAIANNSYLESQAANGMMRKFHLTNGQRLETLSLESKGIKKKISRNDFN